MLSGVCYLSLGYLITSTDYNTEYRAGHCRRLQSMHRNIPGRISVRISDVSILFCLIESNSHRTCLMCYITALEANTTGWLVSRLALARALHC